MSAFTFTRHAEKRVAQRGIREKDLDLAMEMGTDVPGGILVREKDCDEVVRQLKRRIERVQRLKGVYIVVAGESIITAYHANGRKERALLRR